MKISIKNKIKKNELIFGEEPETEDELRAMVINRFKIIRLKNNIFEENNEENNNYSFTACKLSTLFNDRNTNSAINSGITKQ